MKKKKTKFIEVKQNPLSQKSNEELTQKGWWKSQCELTEDINIPSDSFAVLISPEHTHFLKKNPTLIGRSRSSTISLQSRQISVRHCSIFVKTFEMFEGDSFTTQRFFSVWIEDRSTNGTFVNNKRISSKGKFLLSSSDSICLVPSGSFRVEFRIYINDCYIEDGVEMQHIDNVNNIGDINKGLYSSQEEEENLGTDNNSYNSANKHEGESDINNDKEEFGKGEEFDTTFNISKVRSLMISNCKNSPLGNILSSIDENNNNNDNNKGKENINNSDNTKFSKTKKTPKNDLFSDFFSKFKILDVIGSGAYATVRRVINKFTGQLFALKIVKKSSLKPSIFSKNKNSSNNNKRKTEKKEISISEHENDFETHLPTSSGSFSSENEKRESSSGDDCSNDLSSINLTSKKVKGNSISNRKVSQHYENNKKEKEKEEEGGKNDFRMLDEAIIMKQIDHPNIVKLYNIIETENELCFLLEYANYKDLFDYIVSHPKNSKKSKLSEEESFSLFSQILKALSYLHRKKIIHRDLKPENILLHFEKEKNSLIVKISDFGLSRIVKPLERVNSAVGTLFYNSPELLMGKDYGEKVDYWSLGVILYVMVIGMHPFCERKDKKSVSRQIIEGDFKFPTKAKVSSEVKDLIKGLLCVNYRLRFGYEDVVSSQWFKKFGS